MDQIVAEARDAFSAAEADRDDGASDHETMHEEALEEFDACVQNEDEDRQAALDDIRFARLAEQWPADIRQKRESEKRACLTINKLPSFIRQVVNEGRQNRPSIKIRPADDKSDVLTAQVMQGLIRNVEYTSNADVAYDTALECAVGNGFGYWRVALRYATEDSFDLEPSIDRIANPFTVYRDPRSTAADSSDWNLSFVTEMVPMSVFEKAYRGAETAEWDAQYDGLKDPWRDGESIRLAEYWKRTMVDSDLLQLNTGAIISGEEYRRQQWLFEAAGLQITGNRRVQSHRVKQYILSGAEVLSEQVWPGRYIPIVPVYGDEVNVEGKRTFRSMIRDAKDTQRSFNYWRTAATELVALAPKAPWVGAKGAFTSDKRRWQAANTDNHSFLEYDPVPNQPPPSRQPFAGVPAGALQEAMNASDDMKSIMGIFDASLGARSNETSGVAIVARQREGDVSNFHFIDNLSRGIKHTGRILIDLIPKVITGPRIVRVIGADEQGQNVPVNQQMQMPDGSTRIFDLTAGKYDLMVESGPSYTTKRQEAAAQMLEFMRAIPQSGALLGDLLAKNLDWPGADELAQRMKMMLPPQLQGQGQGDPRMMQMQQAIQQMQMQLQQGAQAYQAMQQELNRAKGELAIKAREAEIKAYGAETDRLKVTGAAMDPQQVQMLVMQTLRELIQGPDLNRPPGPFGPQQMQPPMQPPMQMQPQMQQMQPPQMPQGGPPAPPQGRPGMPPMGMPQPGGMRQPSPFNFQ